MLIRAFGRHDQARLVELTIDTFRPFYEDSFRPLVGEVVFAHQYGDRREDYHKQVSELHAPELHKYVAVAETGGAVAGYVAWNVGPARRDGRIEILAVAPEHRRDHAGTRLCEHAFDEMRRLGAQVVAIGTGGDPFHAPARALSYRQL